MSSSKKKSLRKVAKALARAGLSIVPIKADGSKSPAIDSWRELQDRILSNEEIKKYFKPGLGLAIIAGEVSGNLEILDFDVPKDEHGKQIGDCVFDAWLDCLDFELFETVQTMPTVRTPSGGVHLYYRCERLDGNQKLAMQVNLPGVKPHKSTIVETRGRGGYVLAPGSPPECHPSKSVYKLVSGSFLPSEDGYGVPVITSEQRLKIFSSIRSFDQSGLKSKKSNKNIEHSPRDGNRPGDDYNRRADWADILEPHGWTFAFERRDGAKCWRRPGKPRGDRGISATVRNIDGIELFHSFSSNCDPLPHDESITKFTAYTLFNHNGDYEEAARTLGSQGYGEQLRKIIDLDSIIYGKRDDSVPWSDDEPGVTTRISEELEFKKFNSKEIDTGPTIVFDEKLLPDEVSIFNEIMDPLEVQLFENEEALKKEKDSKRLKEELKLRNKELAKGPAYLVWRDFGDPPSKKLTKEGRIKAKVDRPRDTAWIILNDHFSSDDGIRTIHYQNEQFMVWNGQRYRALKFDDIRPSISRYLSHFAEYKCDDEDGNPTYEPYKIRNIKIIEMVKTVQDMVHIDGDITDPCWLGNPSDIVNGEHLPDPREVVCCKNGLLDISNKKLLKPTPAFYSFNNTGILYDPDAPTPEAWLEFLDSSLDKESQILLQQWFGYCLVQDTRLQKMLMVVGKPGSGKGTAMSVLRKLVGESACCSMGFEKFDMNFGLQHAIGKSLMVFPDARQNAKFDIKGSAVGFILSITGEDDLQIDRKNRDPVTKKLNTRIVIVSNDVMQLTDRSKALSRRMLWIKFPGHDRSPDPNLKVKLLGELSGILNWAIDGWFMVKRSGEFVQPKSADVLKASFEEQSSDISSFIEDMCKVDNDEMVEKVSLIKHWNAWRVSKGYREMGESSFGKLLSSAVMNLQTTRRRDGGSRRNFYIGIGLDSNKVMDYINEYGGSEVWSDLLNTLKVGGKNHKKGDVLPIAEYLDKTKGIKK